MPAWKAIHPPSDESAAVGFRPSCCRSFTIVARLKADAGEIIWTGIRIYETKTVQRLLTRRSGS